MSISIDQHRHQRRHLQHMAWRRLSLHIRLRAVGSAILLANLPHCHGNPSPQLGRVYVWAPPEQCSHSTDLHGMGSSAGIEMQCTM